MRKRLDWTGAFVILGLMLRTVHYLRHPSVWQDEAALMLNVGARTFAELLGPLLHREAAPPLFLWAERAVALLMGDGEMALRLPAYLASCASLFLVALAARRVLRSAAVPWAVLLFAVSDRLLWHTCEAKPYAVDVLIAALVLTLFVALSSWPLHRQLLLHAVLAPPLVWLSYPACFVYGGLLVALLPATFRARRAATWAAYGTLALAVLGAFGLLLLGPIHAQRNPMMDACWIAQFPDWDRPAQVPAWMVFSTFDVARYCFAPTGHALGLLALLGAVALWRGGRRALVVVMTLPLGLALAASLVRAYPYGGARVEVYAAPALALLTAAGALTAWQWLRVRARWGGVVLAALLLAPAAETVYHAVLPWPRPECRAAVKYVLAHRRADEPIAGNSWTDEYYLRGAGSACLRLTELPTPLPRRLWLVITAMPASLREKVLKATPGAWRTVERREFQDVTVVLLEQSGAE